MLTEISVAPVIGVDIQVSVAVVVAEGDALPITKHASRLRHRALTGLFGERAVAVVDVQVEPGAAG